MVTNSKQVLAYLRGGDFAHPGETGAIELAMKPIVKNPRQKLLDVGCGLGGTADYIQRNGWGSVTGIDIDSSLISYAQKQYPHVRFYNSDVMKVQSLFPEQKFDVIYHFSSFFCFPSQQECLTVLSKIAAENAELIIFDYSILGDHHVENPFPWSKTISYFHPIHLEGFKKTLLQSGWKFKESIDITHLFQTWYENLIAEFDKKRNDVIHQFGEETFITMYKGYNQLLHEMQKKRIGGVIVYASLQK